MKNIDFSMTYLALKMFGKQLYSNISAAISELVANGLDANAENVYVYMDIRDKNNSTIAIYDDGDGMDEKCMEEEYAVVGRNKRENLLPEEADTKMGRKGIGKLAALYLSDTYYIITKKEANENVRSWLLDVSNIDDARTPQLIEVEYPSLSGHIFESELKRKNKGTIILLNNVFVKNFGYAAEEALEYKLANYFLVDKMSKNIKLCILRKNGDEIKFSDVKKNIAFKNMAVIYSTEPEEFSVLDDQKVCCRDKSIKTKSQVFEFKREIISMPNEIDTKIEGKKISKKISDYITIEGKKYKYEMTGWIGIHSTIDAADAKLNCDNFVKNMHYNPNQLRVYVRNKLATFNFLNYVDMTATFLNYIEGEISFDVLDVEGLEDIATAGRDNFSVQDVRVQLLIVLVKGILGRLVSKRQKIADNISLYKKQIEFKNEEEDKKDIKNRFKSGMIKSKNVFEKLSQDEKEAIEDDFYQFSRASNLSNKTNRIFISHKSDCKEFGELLIDILIEVCPPIKNRIIFSSNSDFGVPQGEDIYTYLQTCFRDDLHIIFLFSRSFYDSNVCLGEAGVAWGTNKKYSNFVLDIGFSDIDSPINRNQKGAVLLNMCDNDFKDFAKEIIRILISVGVNEEFEIDYVEQIVRDKVRIHKDKLFVPAYVPHRKFQLVPKCNNCGNKMKIEIVNDNLKYVCGCGNSFAAVINE